MTHTHATTLKQLNTSSSSSPYLESGLFNALKFSNKLKQLIKRTDFDYFGTTVLELTSFKSVYRLRQAIAVATIESNKN